MRLKFIGWAGCALATFGLCACTLVDNWVNPKEGAGVPSARPSAGPYPLDPLLQLISGLPQKDPAQQAEVFQAVKDAAELTPTTSNRLRYALALATPGHGGSDPVAAQRQLSEILAKPETLLPAERMLAAVELRQVEQRLILQAETLRLQNEAAQAAHDKLGAINRRLDAEIEDNARLRKALEDARAKLEAVTHIERSINDHAAVGPRTH